MKVKESWKYSTAAAEALINKRYSWRITKNYLASHGNEGKDLDPVVLDKYVQMGQETTGWMAVTLVAVVLAKPAKFLIKRKLRKRKNRAK